MKTLHFCLIVVLLFGENVRAAAFQLAPNAPADAPVIADKAKQNEIIQAIQPCIAKARETFPEVKQRYLEGKLLGSMFSVTTLLHDNAGHQEAIFIVVRSMQGGRIYGAIADRVDLVLGYKLGDPYELPESAILDWTISKPDCTEDGNCIGRLLDSMHSK